MGCLSGCGRALIFIVADEGRSFEQFMDVLKLCVVQGVQACNLGVPILAEELARKS